MNCKCKHAMICASIAQNANSNVFPPIVKTYQTQEKKKKQKKRIIHPINEVEILHSLYFQNARMCGDKWEEKKGEKKKRSL